MSKRQLQVSPERVKSKFSWKKNDVKVKKGSQNGRSNNNGNK